MAGLRTLPTRDRAIIGMLAFSILVAETLELYWIVYRTEMTQRTDLFARLLAIF